MTIGVSFNYKASYGIGDESLQDFLLERNDEKIPFNDLPCVVGAHPFWESNPVTPPHSVRVTCCNAAENTVFNRFQPVSKQAEDLNIIKAFGAACPSPEGH